MLILSGNQDGGLVEGLEICRHEFYFSGANEAPCHCVSNRLRVSFIKIVISP